MRDKGFVDQLVFQEIQCDDTEADYERRPHFLQGFQKKSALEFSLVFLTTKRLVQTNFLA